ncbi:hypothetical protein MD535_10605 [Vibrio sp. ZSDZ65]|uniref:Fimbrial protein n=1 Tax=Vibrio qingdaonensis TaxID=2829491 RepID=A0A9X3CN55_9VIBR|nr:hypothetical protein [Vibrio qingdaonensis]MCW8346451.1 hypothetical protein [Vibrio qingdaonensis]
MKLGLFSILTLILTMSFNVSALDDYRCVNSKAILSYVGENIPLGNSEYLDGEVLGRIFVTLDYDCQTRISPYTKATARIGLAHPTETIDSTVSGLKLRSLDFSNSIAGNPGTLVMMFTEAEHPTGRYNGSVRKAIFEVVKSGDISYENNKNGIQLWALGQFEMINYMWENHEPEYNDITFNQTISQTGTIPAYKASCDISHPSNITIPTLIKGVNEDVSIYFNISLNCTTNSLMENNIDLTVTPTNMNNSVLSQDKSTLIYNDGQVVTMNIFNNVGGSESPMLFSTKYQFNNDTQGNSFTIPMQANFKLGNNSDYGSFSFQTYISVHYN